MKKRILLFICLCFCASLFAQYQVTIEALVLDQKTKQPIPYVNIGFVDKTVGTVSNTDGKFTLIYHEDIIGGKEVLQFSALGYRTLRVRASRLFSFLKNTNKFFLVPEPYILEEVLLTNEKRNKERLGTSESTFNTYGYWKGDIALGGEITTKIKIKKKSTKLLDLKFKVVENTADSLKIRINVYDYKNSYPRHKLVTKNIVHTITTKRGQETINLEPYDINVDDDVVVGIELLEVFGDGIEFAISANNKTGKSFTKRISQDKWNRHTGIGMNFTVLTSYPVDDDSELISEREKPSKITLYWDTSLLMKERQLGKELDFLSNYFNTIRTAEVEVVKFGASKLESKVFTLHGGGNKAIYQYLKNTVYDGAANYSKILKSNDFKAETILLFTDGNSVFYELSPEINIPIFCVNSKSEANHVQLQKTAFYADGHYINLYNSSPKKMMKLILNDVDDKTDYTSSDFNAFSLKNVVKGNIFGAGEPIQGATIRVKNSFVEVQSNVDGSFQISAEKDDILEVYYIGMLQKDIMVSHFNNGIVELEPDGTLLEAIIVEAKKSEQKKIESAYGETNYDAIGYGGAYISAEDIRQSDIYLSQILSRVSGVTVTGFGDQAKVSIRTNGVGRKSPLFDVDGIISSSLPLINPQNIANISILKSLASTNRYGAAGAGGVILIKSKASLRGPNGEIVDMALVKGNNYEENLSVIIPDEKETWYMKQFQNINSYEEALEVYRSHKKTKLQLGIPYYLDVAEYFKKWNEEKAFTILSNIAEIANTNPKALKVLAYKFEALGRHEEALKVNEQILVLRPNAAQSYRDLAGSYIDNKKYSEAIDLYKNMINNTIKGVDFLGLKNTINNELKHLALVHRSKINFSDLDTKFLSAKFKVDLRIVFEWTDSSTEFELQFVNPKKKYFKWTHSAFENKELLISEIKNGYNTKEFLIDDAEEGEWIINIECLSKEPLLNPTYLKYTVYKNYGLPNETKSIRLVKLYQQQQKVTLDKFLYQ